MKYKLNKLHKKPSYQKGKKKKRKFIPHNHQELLDGKVTHPGERLFIIREENRRIEKKTTSQPLRKRIKRTNIFDLYQKGKTIKELAIIFHISEDKAINLISKHYTEIEEIAAE